MVDKSKVVLKIIKGRKAIRKYKDKPIPEKIIKKIIEAGRWGPSIHGIQPWKFVVIKNKEMIKKITDRLIKKSKKIGAGANILLHFSADVIRNAPILIAIYNTKTFMRLAKRYRKSYIKFAKIAEISAISATIQNMILTAENLGLGSCWFTTPLFCEKEINNLLNEDNELIAILTLGYPQEKGRRSKRKPIEETVRWVK
jgi:nitroreductase